MSSASFSTVATPDRQSIQSQWRVVDEDIPEMPTRFVRKDVPQAEDHNEVANLSMGKQDGRVAAHETNAMISL